MRTLLLITHVELLWQSHTVGNLKPTLQMEKLKFIDRQWLIPVMKVLAEFSCLCYCISNLVVAHSFALGVSLSMASGPPRSDPTFWLCLFPFPLWDHECIPSQFAIPRRVGRFLSQRFAHCPYPTRTVISVTSTPILANCFSARTELSCQYSGKPSAVTGTRLTPGWACVSLCYGWVVLIFLAFLTDSIYTLWCSKALLFAFLNRLWSHPALLISARWVPSTAPGTVRHLCPLRL